MYSCEGCKGFFKRTVCNQRDCSDANCLTSKHGQVRKELTYACREDKMCLIDKRQRNRFLSSSSSPSSSSSEIVSLMVVLTGSNTFIPITNNHLRQLHHHDGAGQMPVLPLPKVSTMWDEEGGRAGGEAARQQVSL